MQNFQIEMANGKKAEITVSPASAGDGVLVVQTFANIETTTVTCTCTSDGKTYTTTKQCANAGDSFCDCRTPTNPTITCG